MSFRSNESSGSNGASDQEAIDGAPLYSRTTSSDVLLDSPDRIPATSRAHSQEKQQIFTKEPYTVTDGQDIPPQWYPGLDVPRIKSTACCNVCSQPNAQYPFFSKSNMTVLWHKYNIWALLTMLAITGGIVAYLNETGVSQLTKIHQRAVNHTGFSKGVRFVFWSAWTICCVILSCICVALSASHAAEGSGTAMVKSLLHHWRFFPDWYTFRTYALKFLGLTLTVGSGVFMGRVDVHLCVILSVMLLRLKIFQNVNISDELRYQVLLAGSSVGVSVNFGAPLAGILFAIELSGSFYRTKVYLKTIYVSILGAMTARLLSTITTNIEGITHSDTILAWINIIIPYPIWQFEELPFFIVMGLICGVLGALFVKLNVICQTLKTKYGRMRIWFLGGVQLKFVVAVFVAFLVSILTFPLFIGKFMSLGNSGSIYELTSQRSLDPAKATNLKANDWYNGGSGLLWLNLLIYGFGRYFVTIVCFSMPIPGGPYTPLFAAGVGIGRFFGEMVALILPNTPVDPGAYAVVFAGALTAGATHQRFSSALIVLELTGRAVTLPLLIAVLISSLVAGSLYPTLPDAIIHLRGWGDYVEPEMRTDDRIEEFMHTDFPYLLKNTNAEQVDAVLLAHPTILEFPVINSTEARQLLGVVTKEDLEYLLMKAWQEHSGVISEILLEPTPQDKMGAFYKSGEALQEQNNIRDELDAARARQVIFNEQKLELPDDIMISNAPRASIEKVRESLDRQGRDELEMVELGQSPSLDLPEDNIGDNIVRGEEPAFSSQFTNARDEALGHQRNLQAQIHIQPRPVSLVVAPTMTVISLHAIFTMCRLSVAYIIDNGTLVGTVPATEIRNLGSKLKTS